MTTFIEVERSLHGFPSRTPDAVAILDIEISASVVHRHIIISIPSKPAELGILEKRITASRVGNEREEILVAQIVDPRPRSLRICYYILSVCVIKMTIFFVFHVIKISYFSIKILTSTAITSFSSANNGLMSISLISVAKRNKVDKRTITSA